MDKKEQTMRISDEEISVLKNTFAENDVLLKSVRKAMLNLPMTEEERTYLASLYKSEELMKVTRRMFLPTIEGDTPLGQNIDLWMTLNISDKLPEQAHLLLHSRKVLIEMIEKGLQALTEPSDLSIAFEPTDDIDEDYINLLARNTLLTHIDQQLMQIKILSGRKEETVEQTKSRLAKDSAK
jgi:hypothetical protein